MTEYWTPKTEADLKLAVQEGLLTETHVFDVKKQPPPSAKNIDIAIDLASFACDGGRILYGVSQPKSNGPTTLVPFDTTGLAERLDQIARGTIDRPLRIRCINIPSEEKPELGYLLVVIPPSPDAPHMVDGRYRYRSDRTNTIPSDAEMRRLTANRERFHVDVRALLLSEIARDPSPVELRTLGHFFIVAQPISGAGDLLQRALATSDWRAWLEGEFQTAVQSFGHTVATPPDLFREAITIASRANGWAISTYEIGADRRIRPNGAHPAEEVGLLDLEVRDDGGLRLFCGRGSISWQGGVRLVYWQLIATLIRRVVRGVLAVSDRADFSGGWGLGLAIREMGAAAMDAGPISGLNARDVGDYDEVRAYQVDELRAAPDAVVQHLLGRYFRAYGILGSIGMPS